MNMNMLMQQAKKMQKDMENAKNEVGNMTFESKKDLVTVSMNGKKRITKIEINKDVEKEDIEVLEDMITLAVNELIAQAEKEMEDRLGQFGSGLSGLL